MSLPSPEAPQPQQAVRARPTYPQPPTVAPYHPSPAYPPPALGLSASTDGRAMTSLVASIFGILLAIPSGLPGLVLGPIAYFLGRSATVRIDAAAGSSSGRGMAVGGSVLGILATAIGAVVSRPWLVLLLVAMSTTPTLG